MDSLKRIAELESALLTALADEDWQRIAELDVTCQTVVQSAVDEVTARVETGQDKSILMKRIKSLIACYQRVMVACESQKQEVLRQMQQLKKEKQAAIRYANLSGG